MYIIHERRPNRIACLLLAALMLLCSLALLGCNKNEPKDDTNNPFSEFINSTQKEKLEVLAEAFAESGYAFDNSNPITFRDVELFICYYYDDKVLAGENGYGSVPAADADAFCEEVFGIKPTLRYNNTFEDEVLFYFDDDSESYLIKPKDNFASDVELESVEVLEEGGYLASIKVSGTDGSQCLLELGFLLNKDAVRIRSCKRYDFN